jgi:hypothetical protein
MGKKGMVKLDKKSVHKLAKIVRQLSGKKGMGWSFTMEGKLTEGISVADERHVGKFLIVILSSGSEMRSAILNKKKNADKYNRNDKKDLKTLWNLAGKYKGKEIKEGKLNEGKVVTLPNGIKVKIDFKGLTFIGGTKPVFLDRNEMMTFFKATAKYLK